MKADIVIGAQYGDEAKGKIVIIPNTNFFIVAPWLRYTFITAKIILENIASRKVPKWYNNTSLRLLI